MRGRALCVILISLLLFQWGAISFGAGSHSGPEFLLDKYHEIEAEGKKTSGPVSFHAESSADKKASHVDIYGTINYPFPVVQSELLVPTNWCEIVLSHPDVRACMYGKVNDTWQLKIYHTNKSSESLEDASEMKLLYRVSELQPAYFDIALTAKEGPTHTRDHYFGLEAVPLENSKTFIHLRYSFSYSALGYYLMKIFGRGKIGFSVTGTDNDGNPVHVGGLRGLIERDIACYYLAILSYLDSLKASPEQRAERQIIGWYDLAALYKKQLFEMNREEYLAQKRRDQGNQQRLQGEMR